MGNTYSTVKEGVCHFWGVEGLWELSNSLETSEWEIPTEFLESWSWGQTHPSQHVGRCLSADLSYPILVHEGKIVDGCHRVVKALAQGNTHISAKVLTNLPEPDGEESVSCDDSPQGSVWKYGDMVEVVRAFFEHQKKIEYDFRHPIDGV